MPNTSAFALACLTCIVSGCAAGNQPDGAPAPGEIPGPDSVPVPYGAQPGESVTGAVTVVSVEDSDYLADVLEMLRGRVPGLQIIESPNGDIQLQIRGANQSLTGSGQPLLVIDEMPVRPGSIRLALKGLNPHNVESITVLRDLSSTAIYGTRGANGVILIALKR